MVFFILILASTFCHSEPTYSVNQIVDLALKRSSEIKALKLEAKAKQVELYYAGKWEDPHLELGIDKKEESGGNTHFGRVSISQSLPRFGKMSAKRNLAFSQYAISEKIQEQAEITLRGEILRLILQYKISLEKSHHAKERLDRFKVVATYLQSRPFAAPQKRAEAIIVKSKLLILQKELKQLETSRRVAWNALNVYLELPNEPLIRTSWYRQPQKFELTELIKKFEQKNPQLRQQQLLVSQMEYAHELARAESWSGLTLLSSYEDGSGFSPEKKYSLGLSFSLPTWNGNRGAIEGTESKIAAERLRLIWVREQFVQLLKSSLEVYRTLGNSLTELSPDAIGKMERDMQIVDIGFRKGQIDLMTYLEADAQHLEELNAVFESQMDFYNAFSQLLFLVGEVPQGIGE
ncbi:MAG: TolC family protein [Bdellovibrionales bacterium]|nr:TolC family protein [Bdellovibrionales bacterium]